MKNLYGWAMSDYLHYSRFKWLQNIDECDLNSISTDDLVGYIL